MERSSAVEDVAAVQVVAEHWLHIPMSPLLLLCPSHRIPVCLSGGPVQGEAPRAGHEELRRPTRVTRAPLTEMALLRLRPMKVAVAVQEVLRDPAVEEVLPALVVVNLAR